MIRLSLLAALSYVVLVEASNIGTAATISAYVAWGFMITVFLLTDIIKGL